MRITQEADYALRITGLLAGATAAVGAPNIAESVCVPKRFAMKILRRLAENGVVAAVRGVSGGYRLAIPAEELTLKRVIESIDGPILLQKCLCDDYVCTRNSNKELCRYHRVFASLSAAVAAALDGLTVADMINGDLPIEVLLKNLYINGGKNNETVQM